MGSGKTTVGPLVARHLGWKFIDVDDVIEEETGVKIAEIFARYGEPAFRQREHATIARLATADGLVLALGGGAIERAETRDLLLAAPATLSAADLLVAAGAERAPHVEALRSKTHTCRQAWRCSVGARL